MKMSHITDVKSHNRINIEWLIKHQLSGNINTLPWLMKVTNSRKRSLCLSGLSLNISNSLSKLPDKVSTKLRRKTN